jgi:hypothetical protein
MATNRAEETKAQGFTQEATERIWETKTERRENEAESKTCTLAF